MRPCLIFLLLAVMLVPLLAQRGGGVRETTTGPTMVSGRIVEINREQRTLRIAVLVQVSDPNAAGKVPDELAQKAAALAQEADRAAAEGKAVRAQMLRQQVAKLLSWREVETTITPDADRVSVHALRRVAASTIKEGMRITFNARFDGMLTAEQMPARVTQTSDARILNNDEGTTFVRIVGKPMPQTNTTFLEVTGLVTGINPLVVSVNDTSIQVGDNERYSAQQITPIDGREVQPGQRIYAQVQLKNETTITRVHRVVIILMNYGNPLPPE
jgi:hypothetical protein